MLILWPCRKAGGIPYSGTKSPNLETLPSSFRYKDVVAVRCFDGDSATYDSMTSHLALSGRPIGHFAKRGASLVVAVLVCLAASVAGQAQILPWSQRIANSVMDRWPDGYRGAANDGPGRPIELGILLSGMDAAWYESADGDYYHYAKRVADQYVALDRSTTKDDLALGRQLLLLYRVTQDPKYYKAANRLRGELATQLKTASRDSEPGQEEGGRTGLEEFYLAEPFYAEYASVFQEPTNFRDITEQFVSTGQRARSLSDGVGWYMMALVDSLEFYPSNDPGRGTLLAILGRTAKATILHRDKPDGLSPQSYKETARSQTASCMLIYSLQKGVRMGYLPQRYSQDAKRAWQGVTSSTSVRGVSDDAAETGACLLAATEIEMGSQANPVHGETVLIDSWFNSQQRRNAAGHEESFHYKWGDYSDSGFSLLGHIFASHGATLAALDQAPTAALLKRASYYIIASPDIPIKNPHPNYMEAKDAAEIAKWVEDGGVLVLMPNDPANGDIDHLDLLADKFGIHFDKTLAHHVVGDQFSPGLIPVAGDSPLFQGPHALYMKDTCTISLTAPARPLLSDETGVVIATAKYGKGTVAAVIDPWLYNEYTDHRKVLPEQDNFAAGKEFVDWLLQQPHRSTSQQRSKHEADIQ